MNTAHESGGTDDKVLKRLGKWLANGTPWVWLNAAAVSTSILLVTGLLTLIAARGLVHFRALPVQQIVYQQADGSLITLAGQIREQELVTAERLREAGVEVAEDASMVRRYLLKVGNRDIYGQDFRWVLEPSIISNGRPRSMVVLERQEWGVFIGLLVGLRVAGELTSDPDIWSGFQTSLARADTLREEISALEKHSIGRVNYRLERLRLKQRGYELDDGISAADLVDGLAGIEAERNLLQAEYAELEVTLLSLYSELQRDALLVQTADGQQREYPMASILDAYRPNQMGIKDGMLHFLSNVWKFVSDDPREANTEGGVFPAIFGTVLMVLLMTVFVTPLGVVAAVYLKEYAHQGVFTRFIRIAVNNLAGVPSIVYGVFGLGFFVYTLGGSIDQLFFKAALPSPTFGTGGLFWASLTLALLTLPVVIVSTEEGLSRIPRSIREGSLALGATQWETLWRTVLPMASPGIMTGLILAVARAAGEVAPLMLVGVVKLAPALPLDGNAPFLHLDRKFMHLGFHIYDVGFQSPNVEAARPLVYATALLLVAVIVLLNLVAIAVRNRLSERYRGLES